jgi:phage N-6-adenine-methyltransferase
MKGKGNDGSGNIESRDEWETPQWLFDILHEQYGFTYDCCASDKNSKCDVWSDDNFLDYDDSFKDDVHWMNPPFSKALEMFRHFFKVVGKGVAIYRCDNMETKIWQKVIFPIALIGFNIEPPQGFEGKLLK